MLSAALLDETTLSVSHRFLASFFLGALPSPVDIRFSRISGLGRELTIDQIEEGGNNLSTTLVPRSVKTGPLTLERGVMAISPLTLGLNQAMSALELEYLTIMVIVLGVGGSPTSTWTFEKALPTRWSVSDLDATSNAILINSFEFSYSRVSTLGAVA